MARSRRFLAFVYECVVMPVFIRSLAENDRSAWRELWTDYLTFYDTKVSERVYETTFARHLGDDRNDLYGLVADTGGRLVGITHYLFHRHAWTVENTCYLQDLYVAPDARGSGVATHLIEAVYAEADAAKSPNVYWLTQTQNKTARGLYDRIGSQTSFIKYARPKR